MLNIAAQLANARLNTQRILNLGDNSSNFMLRVGIRIQRAGITVPITIY
jgi:hypothetical protein